MPVARYNSALEFTHDVIYYSKRALTVQTIMYMVLLSTQWKLYGIDVMRVAHRYSQQSKAKIVNVLDLDTAEFRQVNRCERRTYGHCKNKNLQVP